MSTNFKLALLVIALVSLLAYAWYHDKQVYQAGYDKAVVDVTKNNKTYLDAVNKRMKEHVQRANQWRLDYEHEKTLLANAPKVKCFGADLGPAYNAARLRDNDYRDKLLSGK